MSPKSLSHSYTQQRGFLIPLSAILVVGIAVLALTISRISSQSNQSSVLEGISLQAFYAAESGAQYGLSRLFFNVTSRTTANNACTGGSALFPETVSFPSTANGLQACEFTISCSFTIDGADTTSFYTLTSDAQCGGGDIVAERSIEVRAFM